RRGDVGGSRRGIRTAGRGIGTARGGVGAIGRRRARGGRRSCGRFVIVITAAGVQERAQRGGRDADGQRAAQQRAAALRRVQGGSQEVVITLRAIAIERHSV